MRIIAQFEKEQLAQRFSYYLQKENIENTLEMQMDNKTKQLSYIIWVHAEDDLEKASNLLKEFQQDPDNHRFDVSILDLQKEKREEGKPLQEEEIKRLRSIIPSKGVEKKPTLYFLTAIFFSLCVMIFFISLMQEINLKQNKSFLSGYQFTPIQLALLYDIPQDLIEFDNQMKNLTIDPSKPLNQQPEDVQKAIENFEKVPKGFYDSIVEKLADKHSVWQMPDIDFSKIREGQIYRLVSPIFLHGGFIHILFNMFWLWFLGKQIEERLSRFKYLVIVLIIAIVSNTLQYVVSGPYFLGFSGVIMGMVGFIWSRQKLAPWEGYPLQRIVYIFLAFYVLAIFALQIFTFVMQLYGKTELRQMIANTAHISGAITGWILGKISWFAGRPLER